MASPMDKAGFIIPGEPRGKGRPRFSRRNGCVTAYTPQKTSEYENLVKWEYRQACGPERFADDERLSLQIFAFYSIPKSASKKDRALMCRGIIRPAKKPDMDNVIKIIADSLNGIAYKDDSQIVDASVRKFYAETPYVYVVLRPAAQPHKSRPNEKGEC